MQDDGGNGWQHILPLQNFELGVVRFDFQVETGLLTANYEYKRRRDDQTGQWDERTRNRADGLPRLGFP
jgi:hypothetical protein